MMIDKFQLKAPALLIAVPQLADPNFFRALVLLVEHSEEGSMGLVINRPIELSMGEFCKSQEMYCRSDRSQCLYQGGPVQTDRAFILHKSGQMGPETEEVFDGICLSYSLESLTMLVEEPPLDMNVFLGYAGWGPDQLVEEVTSGSWLVTYPEEDLLFSVASDVAWEHSLKKMGIAPLQLMHSGAVH